MADGKPKKKLKKEYQEVRPGGEGGIASFYLNMIGAVVSFFQANPMKKIATMLAEAQEEQREIDSKSAVQVADEGKGLTISPESGLDAHFSPNHPLTKDLKRQTKLVNLLSKAKDMGLIDFKMVSDRAPTGEMVANFHFMVNAGEDQHKFIEAIKDKGVEIKIQAAKARAVAPTDQKSGEEKLTAFLTRYYAMAKDMRWVVAPDDKQVVVGLTADDEAEVVKNLLQQYPFMGKYVAKNNAVVVNNVDGAEALLAIIRGLDIEPTVKEFKRTIAERNLPKEQTPEEKLIAFFKVARIGRDYLMSREEDGVAKIIANNERVAIALKEALGANKIKYVDKPEGQKISFKITEKLDIGKINKLRAEAEKGPPERE